MSISKHQIDCSKAGGREDPIKKQIRLLEAQTQNLKIQLKQENENKELLNDKYETIELENKRTKDLLKAEQQKINDMRNVKNNLEESIKQQICIISKIISFMN